MLFLTIIRHYLLWHYTEAYKELFSVSKNLIWFVVHFFSLPQLLRTLFSPWRRIVEEKKRNWNIEDFASRVLINIISRIIGAIMRLLVISIGLVCLLATLTISLATCILWVFMPAIIIGCFALGITYLFV
jgi:hypothetical protein